jgi:hypothetical protein
MKSIFTLSQSIEKLQHFEIRFDGKKTIFDYFKKSPVAMVTGNFD